MRKYNFLLVFCFLLVLISCIKQAPQLPSNKVVVDNSEAKSLLDINQNLARKEDSLLNIFVNKLDKKFLRSELGYWYKVEQGTNGQGITDKSTCLFSYILLLINGKFVEQGQKQIVIGKREVVVGLEEGLKLFHKGDSCTLVIPWYLGFGMKGNNTVPAYTSIIYRLKIKN